MRWVHGTALTVLVVGLLGFLWPLADVVGSLQDWNEWEQPKVAGQLIRCACFGLLAVAGALGINVPKLLGLGASREAPLGLMTSSERKQNENVQAS